MESTCLDIASTLNFYEDTFSNNSGVNFFVLSGRLRAFSTVTPNAPERLMRCFGHRVLHLGLESGSAVGICVVRGVETALNTRFCNGFYDLNTGGTIHAMPSLCESKKFAHGSGAADSVICGLFRGACMGRI